MNALGAIADIIDLCVKGERTATGMQYEDARNAVQLIKRMGLDVVIPEGSELVRLKEL